MVPPLSSAHEWRSPFRARAVDLPNFGQGSNGQSRGEEGQGAEQGRSADQGGTQEANTASNIRVKQEEDLQSPLDEYFCKGMDTSGPAAWAKVLRDRTTGDMPEVGALNAREGVREEKWVSFDLRTVKFPSTQTSSVRRATLIQNFEADFVWATVKADPPPLTTGLLFGTSEKELADPYDLMPEWKQGGEGPDVTQPGWRFKHTALRRECALCPGVEAYRLLPCCACSHWVHPECRWDPGREIVCVTLPDLGNDGILVVQHRRIRSPLARRSRWSTTTR